MPAWPRLTRSRVSICATRRRCRLIGMRYLRDNIKYRLGDEERAGLELFYRYASEIDVAPASDGLRFFGQS